MQAGSIVVRLLASHCYVVILNLINVSDIVYASFMIRILLCYSIYTDAYQYIIYWIELCNMAGRGHIGSGVCRLYFGFYICCNYQLDGYIQCSICVDMYIYIDICVLD